MQVQKVINRNVDQRAFGAGESFEMLLKAQSGIIPVTELEHTRLEKSEVALFLARELLFLRSVAEGAKFSMLAILFDELHVSLLDSAKPGTKLD